MLDCEKLQDVRSPILSDLLHVCEIVRQGLDTGVLDTSLLEIIVDSSILSLGHLPKFEIKWCTFGLGPNNGAVSFCETLLYITYCKIQTFRNCTKKEENEPKTGVHWISGIARIVRALYIVVFSIFSPCCRCSPLLREEVLPWGREPYEKRNKKQGGDILVKILYAKYMFQIAVYCLYGELIFHPNFSFCGSICIQPQKLQYWMICAWWTDLWYLKLFKQLEYLRISAENSKTLQCAYIRKTVLVTRSFSAYIRRNARISKLRMKIILRIYAETPKPFNLRICAKPY